MKTKRFDKNNYEFNTKSKLGIYLIHGFTNTTYEVKELARFLANSGYHTIANNLPGHGSSIDECNRIKYSDWINVVTKDIAILASKSEKTYIIGCSMGAVLALYVASRFPVNGCIVGGTVLKFRNHYAVNFLVPWICRFKKILKKPTKLKSSTKFYGYAGYPLRALNEFRKLNKVVRKKLGNITAPTLIIHSLSDGLSIKKNVDIVVDSIKSHNKEVLLVKKAHHNLFDTNPDQKLIFNEVLQFLNSN